MLNTRSLSKASVDLRLLSKRKQSTIHLWLPTTWAYLCSALQGATECAVLLRHLRFSSYFLLTCCDYLPLPFSWASVTTEVPASFTFTLKATQVCWEAFPF